MCGALAARENAWRQCRLNICRACSVWINEFTALLFAKPVIIVRDLHPYSGHSVQFQSGDTTIEELQYSTPTIDQRGSCLNVQFLRSFK